MCKAAACKTSKQAWHPSNGGYSSPASPPDQGEDWQEGRYAPPFRSPDVQTEEGRPMGQGHDSEGLCACFLSAQAWWSPWEGCGMGLDRAGQGKSRARGRRTH